VMNIDHVLQPHYDEWRNWFKSVELTELSRTASFTLSIKRSILPFSCSFMF